MKYASIVRTHVEYGAEPKTHVLVEIFDVLGPGLRRRVDALDMSYDGATDNYGLMKAAVETRLREANVLGPAESVLTEPEARGLS